MSAIEVLPDLFFFPRGYLNGNHLVYASDEPVLIDTAYQSGFSETEELLTGVGVDLSRIQRIINTHGHSDHIGGNRFIQRRSGCDIAMHPIGKHFMDIRDDWSTWWRYYAQEAEFFDCTTALEDGEMVNLGPHEFEVIHTPGHSADGLVLYHRKNRLLVSSDTLWGHDLAVLTVRVEGSRALFSMLESLDRLEALEVRTVCPGHGEIFSDHRLAVSKAQKRVQRFLADPSALGKDLIKKIVVFTLMMRGAMAEDSFFSFLLSTPWFPETVDLYFNRDYGKIYQNVMEGLIQKGVVVSSQGYFRTTVKP